MDPIALSVAILSLIASGVAIALAFRAADRAQRTVLAAAGNAFANQPQPPPQPTREERIAWARGAIAGERALDGIGNIHGSVPSYVDGSDKSFRTVCVRPGRRLSTDGKRGGK